MVKRKILKLTFSTPIKIIIRNSSARRSEFRD